MWASTVVQSTRPTAGDVLMGSVYVLLSALLSPAREIAYVCVCMSAPVARVTISVPAVAGTLSSSQALLTLASKHCTCSCVSRVPVERAGQGFRSW